MAGASLSGGRHGFLPLLRWLALIPYGAAALAKLNAGFFSEHSCAVELCHASLEAVGSPDLPTLIVATLPLLVASAELAVVALLLSPRTRVWGVAWATLLHLGMAVSPTAEAGLGFTLALYALLVGFLPPAALQRIHHRLTNLRRPLQQLRPDLRQLVVVAGIGVVALVLGDYLQVRRVP